MQAAEQLPDEQPEDGERLALQRRVQEQARRFDLPALLDVLAWLGYAREQITLKSHDSTLQQSAVVESVSFAAPPARRVTVVVNLGWLGPQTALPVYFRAYLEQDRGDLTAAFLSFFSQVLLWAGLDSSFPERQPSYFHSFAGTRAQLRSLLGVRSLSTIHWVFAQTFPEAETAVQHTTLMRPLRNRGMVLGDWQIGDGMSCGGLSQVPVAATSITLYVNEPCDGLGTPWAQEAERRLQRECFPALASPGLFLRVQLVIRDQTSFMVLQSRQYLGYEALRDVATPALGGSAAPASRPHKQSRTIVLWSGEVPQPGRKSSADKTAHKA